MGQKFLNLNVLFLERLLIDQTALVRWANIYAHNIIPIFVSSRFSLTMIKIYTIMKIIKLMSPNLLVVSLDVYKKNNFKGNPIFIHRSLILI